MPLCGNSIGQDRRFLARYMPRLGLLPLPQRGCEHPQGTGQALEAEASTASKAQSHTALADVHESDELVHYRKHFLADLISRINRRLGKTLGRAIIAGFPLLLGAANCASPFTHRARRQRKPCAWQPQKIMPPGAPEQVPFDG